MNKIFILGNVGENPAVKEFGENKVANFQVATRKRGFKTKDGKEVEERTLWHHIVCRNGLATIAEKYVKKGTKVLIEGEINYREYTKDDNKMYITEIIADNMEILSKPETKDERPF